MIQASSMTDEVSAGVHVVRFSATDVLDASGIREMRRRLGDELNSQLPVRIVLDLQDVLLLSSDAIGMIVAICNTLQPRGGRIHLANLSTETYTVFEIMRLHRVIRIFDSSEEAVAAFASCRS